MFEVFAHHSAPPGGWGEWECTTAGGEIIRIINLSAATGAAASAGLRPHSGEREREEAGQTASGAVNNNA